MYDDEISIILVQSMLYSFSIQWIELRWEIFRVSLVTVKENQILGAEQDETVYRGCLSQWRVKLVCISSLWCDSA